MAKKRKKPAKKAKKPAKTPKKPRKKRVKRPKPQLEWKRAVRDETEISNRRTWRSRCGRYYVQESVPKLRGLGTIFYAVHVESNTIIGRRKVRRLAEQECEDHLPVWAQKEAVRKRMETINAKKRKVSGLVRR